MRVLHVIIREHLPHCRDRKKGPHWTKCLCPKWVDGAIRGKRIRRSLKTADWSDAERKAVQIERDGGIFEEKLLSEAIADWEASWQISDTSARKYRQLTAALLKWAKAEQIATVEEITLEALDRFYNSRGKARGKELSTLRAFFRFCIKRRWTRDNPALDLKPPKASRDSDIIPFNQAEIVSMIAACDRLHNDNPILKDYTRKRAKAMLLLLWQTALRLGDAYALKRESIHDGVLFIRAQKNNKPIRHELSAEVIQALEALPRPMHDQADGAYYFWTGNEGKASSPRQHMMVVHAHRMLKPVFKLSGVKNAHAHRFRHTLATNMLAAGATMSDVAVALGDSVSTCEKYYAKYDIHRHIRAAEFVRKAQNRGRLLEHAKNLDSKPVIIEGHFMAEREGFAASQSANPSEINTLTSEEKAKRPV